MITFDRGYFFAAMLVNVWKCSKHGQGVSSTSFVLVRITMAEGVPKCSLFKKSIVDAIVGELEQRVRAQRTL